MVSRHEVRNRTPGFHLPGEITVIFLYKLYIQAFERLSFFVLIYTKLKDFHNFYLTEKAQKMSESCYFENFCENKNTEQL